MNNLILYRCPLSVYYNVLDYMFHKLNPTFVSLYILYYDS